MADTNYLQHLLNEWLEGICGHILLLIPMSFKTLTGFHTIFICSSNINFSTSLGMGWWQAIASHCHFFKWTLWLNSSSVVLKPWEWTLAGWKQHQLADSAHENSLIFFCKLSLNYSCQDLSSYPEKWTCIKYKHTSISISARMCYFNQSFTNDIIIVVFNLSIFTLSWEIPYPQNTTLSTCHFLKSKDCRKSSTRAEIQKVTMIEIKINFSPCKLQISTLPCQYTLCMVCLFDKEIPLFKDQVFNL